MEDQEFTVPELIHNDSFQRIIDGSASTEEKEYWNQWMEASEANRQKVQQAMAAIAGFRFAVPVDSDKENQWARIYNKTIKKTDKYEPNTIASRSSNLQWIFRVVAAVLLIATVGAGVYWHEISKPITELTQISKRITVSTDANEQKILRFTNGDSQAKIVMNSNSTITYGVGLLENQTINVNLQGEAFFDVEEGFSGTPAFSVTTPDGVIEDIGTEFMVTVGERMSRVVLQEGLVNVQAMQGKTVLQEFQVAKGEMIEFTAQEIVTKSKVNSTFFTSWATGHVEFEQTKISAFAKFIENRYGATVKIVDPELADATIDGAAYFRSLEELVRSVSDVMEIPVYQSASRDTIFIGRQYGG